MSKDDHLYNIINFGFNRRVNYHKALGLKLPHSHLVRFQSLFIGSQHEFHPERQRKLQLSKLKQHYLVRRAGMQRANTSGH